MHVILTACPAHHCAAQTTQTPGGKGYENNFQIYVFTCTAQTDLRGGALLPLPAFCVSFEVFAVGNEIIKREISVGISAPWKEGGGEKACSPGTGM